MTSTDEVRNQVHMIDGFRTGQAVEVWCATTGRFAPGFRVAESTPEGVTVIRESDGFTIPVRLDHRSVRVSPLRVFTRDRAGSTRAFMRRSSARPRIR